LLCTAPAIHAQSYKAPRTPDGKPDLQGIWQARTTAYAALETHGAASGIPAGMGVVVDPTDGKIPYKPEALERRKKNFETRQTADPLGKCFLPGVPRATYLPFPFQIFQTSKFALIAYEFVHATRTIPLDGGKHLDQIDFWMGDSRGHWEGDTLVVDVADLHDETWLDLAGDYHSDALKVVERYTRTGPETLQYEATIEDPNVYTRPWKISMPLYLHTEKNFQLYEYECHDYLEEAAAKKN
ncbi:MAG: hypothetical protein JO062_24170, partial [Bryobacterales bacterium]|nr:hypothetical protein [Bryobacterales bacterium]